MGALDLSKMYYMYVWNYQIVKLIQNKNKKKELLDFKCVK